MAELTRAERLKRITPADIEDTYRRGYITAQSRNRIMREKARSTVGVLLEENGFFMAIWERSIQHLQEGWDKIVEGAAMFPEGEAKSDPMRSGRVLWGMIQALTAPLNAIGEVTGQVAENMALKAGASPGLARVINISADVGTGFVPIGLTAKVGAKVVQKGGKATQALGRKVAAEGAEKAVAEAAQAEKVISRAFAEGLEAEGVTQAGKAVPKQAAGKIAAGTESLPASKSDYVQYFEGQGWTKDQAEKMASKMESQTWYHGSNAEGAKAIEEAGSLGNYQGRIWLTPSKEQAEYYSKINGGKVFSVNRKDIPRELLHPENIELSTGGPAISLPSGWKEFANVRIPTISVKDQFLADLNRFQREMKAITTPQAHEETARLAKKLDYTLDDLRGVFPGQALDEKQMFAYLKALEPQVDELMRLAKVVVSEGTEEASNALARQFSELSTVMPIFRGAEVTAGRSVEILKEVPPMKKLTDMLMGWDPDSLAKGDFAGAMKTQAEDLVALADDKAKLTALTVQMQSGWARLGKEYWPMAREAYINLLLSRPLTHVRNMVGNSIAAANNVMERMTGAAFSIDKQAGLVGKEGLYQAKGMKLAMGDGLKVFADAYKTLSPEDISKLDYPMHKIPGRLGRIVNLPGDTLRGMDNFFKVIAKRGSYYASALRDGVHAGLKGDDLGEFVARRVSFPTEKMVKEADDLALTVTFQNDLGKLGEKARALQTGPLALWFPFMKTPINLAKYAWNRTPGLQLLSKSLYDDILAGGARADMAIGRLTISNLQAMFLFELAQEGMITGGGPIDPALRKAWLATHEPYSIRTKNGWMPISNTEPGSTVFGLIADYAQVMNQLDDPTAEQGAMAVAFVVMKDLADKTYWQTVGDVVDFASALSRGEEVGPQAKRVAAGPLITVATGGPVGAAIARGIDPIRREARTIVDGYLARTPGYSSTLPPLRDGYGDPVLPPQAIGGPWVGFGSPFLFKPETTDRVKQEGDRLNAKLPRFPWNVGGSVDDDFDLTGPQPGDKYGVELAPEQRDKWQQNYRRVLRHKELGIEAIMNTKEYQGLTLAGQRETFSSGLADAKSMAFDALLVEDPSLAKKIFEQDARSVAPLLQRGEQLELEAQTREAIDLFDTLAPEQRDNLLRWGILEPEPRDQPSLPLEVGRP